MNPCPIPSCSRHARPGQLLCLPHWSAVPYPMQRAVWSTWRAFTKSARKVEAKLAARKPYLDARQAAIDAVTKAESPLIRDEAKS